MITYIPEEFKDGFTEISLLDEDVFSAILRSLSNLNLGLSLSELSELVSSQVSFDKKKIMDIFLSVSAIMPYLDEESDIEECVSDVFKIATEQKLVESNSPLEKRLNDLIDNKRIYYAYKVNDLKTENKNIYVTSKVVTDIRPIFDLNVEKIPVVGITQHTLHIHYQSDFAAPHKDFYVVLTSSEINDLIYILMRADKKEETLDDVYKKLNISKLDI